MTTRSQPPERVVVASGARTNGLTGCRGGSKARDVGGGGRGRRARTMLRLARSRRRFTMPVTGAMSAGDGATPEGQRTPALAVRERSRQSQDEPAHRDDYLDADLEQTTT